VRGASLGLKLRVRILSLLLALLVAGVFAGTLAVGPASAQVPGCKDSNYLCGYQKGAAAGQKDYRKGNCVQEPKFGGPLRSEQGYIDGYTTYCPPPTSTARAAAAASPTATASATASPTATATATATASATASPTATASPLPTTGGPPLVGPLTWVATLTLIASGVGALVLLRRGVS
jgi:hypothetical protein